MFWIAIFNSTHADGNGFLRTKLRRRVGPSNWTVLDHLGPSKLDGHSSMHLFSLKTIYKTQESDSTLNWQYSYADKAILFRRGDFDLGAQDSPFDRERHLQLESSKSHKSGSHSLSLYSPNIDQSLFGFCFTFDYRLENVALDIQLQFKNTNTIHTLDTLNSQAYTEAWGHQVVEIDVLSEIGKILITPR